MPCIFSVDVEDWFHILDVTATPLVSTWEYLPSRVEAPLMRLLDLFDEHQVQTTCFFLGWVAERHPQLVREAVQRGHEIASHGYAHQLVFQQSPAEFRDDVIRAKHILEDLTDQPVLGYRSPGFSVTGATEWFFEELVAAGYRYDSSVFPVPRQHGGYTTDEYGPHVLNTPAGRLVEVPISVAPLLGTKMCFFGGGYLRLFPWWLIRRKTQAVLRNGIPAVFYVHPRELDPDHPRMDMSLVRRFKSYVNLHTTERKVKAVLAEFQPTSFLHYLRTQTNLLEETSCPAREPQPSSISMPAISTPSTARATLSSTV